MRGLDALRIALEPAPEPDPTARLADVAKTFVAKRKTPDCQVPIDGLQVDPDYQRPSDRDKIAEFVRHVRGGGILPAIKVNQRPDGSLWITDGQHRAAAAAICGHKSIEAVVTHVPQQEEQEECNILTKVAEGQDEVVTDALLGAGAREEGKRLVLSLGPGRRVEYVPHAEWVGKTERGTLEISAPNAREVLKTLNLLPDDGRPGVEGDPEGS